MNNPAIGVAQVAVTEFWKSLQALQSYGKAEKAKLDADKLRLQTAYSATRSDMNADRAKANQAMLAPLIHKNSELRIRYAELVRTFNSAVAKASAELKRAGLKTPALSGLGEVATATIVVSVVAVSLLGAAWGIAYAIHEQSAKQTSLINAALAVVNDPNASDAEREEARRALTKAAGQGAGGGDPLGLGNLVPVVGLLALALIVPRVLDMVPRRNPRRRRLRRAFA